MNCEMFIALGSAADAYSQDFRLEDLEKAINEHYSPCVVHKEFDNEEQMKGFEDALEFCSEQCGYGNFWVVVPDSDEERERLMKLTIGEQI